MSLNTSHTSNGVLLHVSEYILVHVNKVCIIFSENIENSFKGKKYGRIYLTSHRIIFNNKKSNDLLQSFSAPFFTISDLKVEQPLLGNSYLKGMVIAQPNGHFIGRVKFKLYFKYGGICEFAKAIFNTTFMVRKNLKHDMLLSNAPPPPYTPPVGWYEASPPAYEPPTTGYYGWLPNHESFEQIPPNTIFISEPIAPFPGLGYNSPYIDFNPPQQPPPIKCRWQNISQPEPQPQPQNEEPDWNKVSLNLSQTDNTIKTCAPTGHCTCKSSCQSDV